VTILPVFPSSLGFTKIPRAMNILKEKIGIGCWQIGGDHEINGVKNGWEPMSWDDRIRLVEREIELGFSFFDTAIGYGDGTSEEILGAGIRNSGKRDKIKICTKVSSSQLDIYSGHDWNSFEKVLAGSLDRLGVDKIDILLFHSPSQELITDEIKDLFAKAKNKGLIVDYGLSARSFDDLKLATKKEFGTFFQWNFSLLEPRANDYFSEKNFNGSQFFIGRSSLYRGLLTEKFVKVGPKFAFNDARSQIPNKILAWVHMNALKIQNLAASVGLTISEFALLYGIMNPSSHLSLVGVRNFENLRSLEKLLTLSQSDVESAYHLASCFEPSDTDIF